MCIFVCVEWIRPVLSKSRGGGGGEELMIFLAEGGH